MDRCPGTQRRLTWHSLADSAPKKLQDEGVQPVSGTPPAALLGTPASLLEGRRESPFVAQGSDHGLLEQHGPAGGLGSSERLFAEAMPDTGDAAFVAGTIQR